MRPIYALLFLTVLSAPAFAAEVKPDASCVYEMLPVLDQNMNSVRAPYLKCLIRGESARTVIKHSYQVTKNNPVYGRSNVPTAWEFYGENIDCAARTEDSRQMDTLASMINYLPVAEALCLYYVNPLTAKIERPNMPIQESSAGVSNNF